jgi:cell division protein FtsI/penicillin-binding protein 2
MAKRLQFRRLIWLALLLVGAFAGLGYRLIDLQVLRHEELRIQAQRSTQREYLLEPRRGDILDAKGNLLATSTFVKTVCANPSLIGSHGPEVARVVAPLLDLDENFVLRKIQPVAGEDAQTAGRKYVVLKRKVPVETWQKVHAAMTNLTFGVNEKKLPAAARKRYQELRQEGVFTDVLDDQLRIYPNLSLASHVLGYVGTEEVKVSGRSLIQTRGKDGIELTLDSKLAGVRGWRVTETDRGKRELVTLRNQEVEAKDGFNVVLTIDSVIQHIVESELLEAADKHSPISISSVVVRPRTGEILAMATLPNYDPNDLDASKPDQRRNRVIADTAEPGSTFKIVVVSSALSDKLVSPTDVFDCERGRFAFAGRILHDHEAYPNLTVEGIVTKSSNIGAAKIGIKMGAERLYDRILAYGFGKATGIPLPGEVRGLVHPVKNWSKVTIAQIPMGHGMTATPLQMVMAMSAIANDGRLMRPMLVDRLEDREGKVVAKFEPQRVRQVISEPAAKQMVAALKTVVSTNGTAAKAMLDHYTAAGKTGTAWKVENKVYVRKYFSSFIGFFPADNPELCISVVLDEPKHGYYGGQTAAPVFKRIAERAAKYLCIPPEDGGELPLPEVVAPGNMRPVKTAARAAGAAAP